MILAFDIDAHAIDLHGIKSAGNVFTIKPCCHLTFEGRVDYGSQLTGVKGRDGLIDISKYAMADVTDLLKLLLLLKIPFTVY